MFKVVLILTTLYAAGHFILQQYNHILLNNHMFAVFLLEPHASLESQLLKEHFVLEASSNAHLLVLL